MEIVQIAVIILTAVGVLNRGLFGLFNFDLVAFVRGNIKFGTVNRFSRLVFLLLPVVGSSR